MSIPRITQEDIDELQVEYSLLDFTHPERQAVLLASGSVDVQAAPGSGKTTLLAAKLSILAKKWQHANRGICVVSHTNVAREEIEARLRESRYGARLFSHPHFIGTIQTFIHKFVSLPLLRSWGIEVRVIDDDEYRRISELRFNADYKLRTLASNSPNKYALALRSLRYIGPELELSCADGTLPGKTAPTYARIEKLKTSLTAEGVFRYDDMFAFAQHTLAKYPALSEALGYRFPLVFVDEMQDTSDAQDELLKSAMGAQSTFQRFGDVNQRILRIGDKTAATFPLPGSLPVSTSKRFGASIAGVANSLRAFGQSIVGDNLASNLPVTLFTFSDESVKAVIPAFAAKAAQLVPAAEIERYGIKAVGQRKDETTTVGCGRFLGDYAAIDAPTAGKASYIVNLHRSLQMAAAARAEARNLAEAASRTRAALLLLLRDLGWSPAKEAKTWRQLEAYAEEPAFRASNAMVESLLHMPTPSIVASDWDVVLTSLAVRLSSITGQVITLDDLREREISRFGESQPAPLSLTRPGTIAHGLSVETIAAVKGETHAATLVLECVYNRKYDVTASLPFLCGEKSSLTEKDANTLSRLHNLFVAATRPRHFLAFAIHETRLTATHRSRLEALGWSVIDVT
ncbi:UvrD-helicase domain-containing protein [Burkholderia cepacia]|uniref:DNA 3'-5' helicase II n=1 Tax=Burkholderia cepacia TaxID=292 RepID=A0A8I1AT03_BURCE|nr:UvrD-helicase domain-containing protein [Burkholderia cepacia]MBH9685852.1 UvrD-helicase domain-containing protein [Burkholderia cepacia]MBH9700441.1 UvrD-helicase domain-containing protein [Burkholderia cepacia]MBH9714064.1 UvrD-helicase domain-containing protein [Burkholderia cepacia]MBH9734408.1 UvrD-helicase domain-containing protein [Burkholderia cepacia]MBX3762850.1 UvrD-helicase domain-containing protein [Burkholderia cepacia]